MELKWIFKFKQYLRITESYRNAILSRVLKERRSDLLHRARCQAAIHVVAKLFKAFLSKGAANKDKRKANSRRIIYASPKLQSLQNNIESFEMSQSTRRSRWACSLLPGETGPCHWTLLQDAGRKNRLNCLSSGLVQTTWSTKPGEWYEQSSQSHPQMGREKAVPEGSKMVKVQIASVLYYRLTVVRFVSDKVRPLAHPLSVEETCLTHQMFHLLSTATGQRNDCVVTNDKQTGTEVAISKVFP